MSDSNRPLLIVYAAAALAVALIGARYLKSVAAEPPVRAIDAGAAPSGFGGRPGSGAGPSGAASGSFGQSVAGGKFHALTVHVAGSVRRPGVVRVRDGDRVGDAIKAAGGPTRRANLAAINLAMRLADGQQVIVPARITVGAGGAAGGDNSVNASGGGGSAGPISLGAATAQQLEELDGVGPGLAAKIIAYRDQHGGFRSVDELAEVPGIGEKRLESLRAQLQP